MKELEGVLKKYDIVKGNLHLENGHVIYATDTSDAWRQLNSFMLSANILKLYRVGNRHVVPRITLYIENWGNLIPLSELGYGPDRLRRLERNYLNGDSRDKCLHYFNGRDPSKVSSHGIHFGSGKKRTPICMVGGTFVWIPGRLHCNFFIRASEVTKTLGADFHFLDGIIKTSTPPWAHTHLGPVSIRLDMAYLLAQWFPLIDILMPGYPLNSDHRFHQMCLRSVRLAQDLSYDSKWKPERRMLRYVRKRHKDFKIREGRVVAGPSFFSRKKKHVS